MKHTQGEWKVKHRNGRLIVDSVLGQVCAINVPSGGDRIRQANAKLIASAPDLLIACQKALHYFTNNINEIHLKNDPKIIALRGAIKKATE